ncbi:hypothetical protein SLEP1_g7267 [Rubroshorea leprosula]|uniref:RNase H type-1 domain-containing protein n=1 Tax=Rubroshorea leprosula TaxID=152421 RepID=A0AAV5HY48_9ROSI|nr:hypothetical protein SLEP1_g7267 [Rubroshorea leprosula]
MVTPTSTTVLPVPAPVLSLLNPKSSKTSEPTAHDYPLHTPQITDLRMEGANPKPKTPVNPLSQPHPYTIEEEPPDSVSSSPDACCFNLPKSSVQKAPQSRTCIDGCWKPPPIDVIKLNTDGAASTSSGQAGAGDGLSFAVARGFTKIIVETDSKVAVTLLNSDRNSFHPFATLLDDCRALLRQPPEVQLRHIYREANTAADLLAKMGTTLVSSVVVLEQCPADMYNMLYLDVMGNSLPRNIVT